MPRIVPISQLVLAWAIHRATCRSFGVSPSSAGFRESMIANPLLSSCPVSSGACHPSGNASRAQESAHEPSYSRERECSADRQVGLADGPMKWWLLKCGSAEARTGESNSRPDDRHPAGLRRTLETDSHGNARTNDRARVGVLKERVHSELWNDGYTF